MTLEATNEMCGMRSHERELMSVTVGVRASARCRGTAPTYAPADYVTELLAHALRAAADPSSTATTVCRLAVEIGVDRRRLVEAWRAASPDTPLRLQDLIGLFVLIRAWNLRNAGASWKEAARQTKASMQRLRAIALRTLGCHLRQIDQAGCNHIRQRIDSVLLPILSCSKTANAS